MPLICMGMPFSNKEKQRDYQKAWYRANRDAVISRSKAYRATNLDKVRAREKAYNGANRDVRVAWREANRDKTRAKDREKYAANPGKHKAYKEANGDKIRARAAVYGKAYREANPEKCREAYLRWKRANKLAVRLHVQARRKRLGSGVVTKDDILALLKDQDGVCFWTGDSLGDGFDIDHIVPLSRGGNHEMGNVCLATPRANRSKGAKMPDVFWGELWG